MLDFEPLNFFNEQKRLKYEYLTIIKPLLKMNKIVKIILIVVAVVIAAFFGLKAFTKSKSPAESAKFDQNGLSVQVDYCRPYKKDVRFLENWSLMEKFGVRVQTKQQFLM